MKNYSASGDVISVTLTAAATSGEFVVEGNATGVATKDGGIGDVIALKRKGIFVDMPKTSAQAWSIWDKVYWDSGNSEFTTTASGNILVGLAAAAAANPSDTGDVLLFGGTHPVAANVGDASSGSAAEINAIRDALVAAGLMADS